MNFLYLLGNATKEYPNLLKALAVFIVGYSFLSVFGLFLRRSLAKSEVPPPLKKSILTFYCWFCFLVLLAASLTTAGVHSPGNFALLSGIALAISLAVQGVLTNLFSAIYISYTKIVQVGQVVEFDGHLGLITEIGRFYTVITTFRNERIFVQNTEICTKKFKNFTVNSIVATDFEFKAANTNKVQDVQDAIWEAIKTVDFRYEDLDDPYQHSEVYVMQYAEDIVVRARVWHRALDGYNMLRTLPTAAAFSFERNNIIPAKKIAVIEKKS